MLVYKKRLFRIRIYEDTHPKAFITHIEKSDYEQVASLMATPCMVSTYLFTRIIAGYVWVEDCMKREKSCVEAITSKPSWQVVEFPDTSHTAENCLWQST